MTGTHPLELNLAVPGGRVEMFAIEDGDYPGGGFTGFSTTTRKQVRYCATTTPTMTKT